jgi:hypothetical protein
MHYYGNCCKQERHNVPLYVLWIGEVIKDLLVEDVKYYIKEIPAKFDDKVRN